MATQHKGAQNHTSAAEHHEHAAHHHREAAKHHESGAHEKAGHHAHMAHGHASHARHHAEEASKHHAQEHGSKKKNRGQKRGGIMPKGTMAIQASKGIMRRNLVNTPLKTPPKKNSTVDETSGAYVAT